jgi:hypothetical protein
MDLLFARQPRVVHGVLACAVLLVLLESRLRVDPADPAITLWLEKQSSS